MKRPHVFARPLLVLLAPALVVGGLTTGPAAAVTASSGLPDRYVVVLHDTVTDVRGVSVDHAGRYGAAVGHVYSAALKGYAATVPAARVAALRADARVAYLTPDTEVFASTTTSVVAGDDVPAGVRRLGAATSTSVHAASTTNVAVIDTGVDLTHPDLNVVNGKNCTGRSTSANDDNGHGSHVAGTIAARNNGSGVVGVAPGTKVYAVKVLDKRGSGSLSSVVCGIEWVTANAESLGIGVANMSLGGSGRNDDNCGNTNNDAEHKAICASTGAGVTYVVAAGNSNADLDRYVPASYPEVLTVTAMADSNGEAGGGGGAPACRTSEKDDTFASFSNYATTAAALHHTIAAPGVCVRSTWKSGAYNTISGTSMATPHVAGAVALCKHSGGVPGPCARLTAAQTVQKLRADAEGNAPLGNGFVGDQPVDGKAFGYLTWAGGY